MQVKALRDKLYGSSQSERVDRKQLELELQITEQMLERLERSKPQLAVSSESEPAEGSPDTKQRRYILPDHLEVITERIIPDEVKADPDAYEEVGTPETTELLDVLPMKVIKRQILKPRFKRKDNRNLPLITAATPKRVLFGGIAGAGLLVHIILSKYLDHLPLYRQEQVFKKRFGVSIARKQMAEWVRHVAEDWLGLIYKCIKSDLLRQKHIHADETPVTCRDPDVKGRSRPGHLWVYRSKDEVYYDWHMSRGRKAAQSMLSGYTGLVQADGYAVYSQLAKSEGFTLLGCMAHARRKFYEAWKVAEEPASEWYLLRFQDLYSIEREHPTARERQGSRMEQSRPILEALKGRLDADLIDLPAKSKTHDAVSYMLNQWGPLSEILNHPEAPIDNNPVEQMIRPTKLGVKNWLFIGHPEAGKRSAILYTILQNCQLQGHNPQEYLLDVLQRLAAENRSEPSFISTLTPKNWKPKSSPEVA